MIPFKRSQFDVRFDDSWTICKQSAPRSRQITTPTLHQWKLTTNKSLIYAKLTIKKFSIVTSPNHCTWLKVRQFISNMDAGFIHGSCSSCTISCTACISFHTCIITTPVWWVINIFQVGPTNYNQNTAHKCFDAVGWVAGRASGL